MKSNLVWLKLKKRKKWKHKKVKRKNKEKETVKVCRIKKALILRQKILQ